MAEQRPDAGGVLPSACFEFAEFWLLASRAESAAVGAAVAFAGADPGWRADSVAETVEVRLPNGLQVLLPLGMASARWLPTIQALLTC